MSNTIGEMLRRLAEQGAAYGPKTKEIAGPFFLDIETKPGRFGGQWAVATDSRAMVWALDWRPVLIHRLHEEQKEIRQQLLTYLFPPAHLLPKWEGRLADIRQFCGAAIWRVPCEACQGLSASNEYVSCAFCENDGWMCPEPRPGYFCDLPLDMARLACVLEPFPGDALVSVIPEPIAENGYAPGRLWIISQRFRILLQGMKPTTEPTEPDLFAKWQTAPRFPALI